jgi:hypothetical protein
VLVFCCYDKISEKINLKEDRSILPQGFRSFAPWSLGSIVKQNIMARSKW